MKFCNIYHEQILQSALIHSLFIAHILKFDAKYLVTHVHFLDNRILGFSRDT